MKKIIGKISSCFKNAVEFIKMNKKRVIAVCISFLAVAVIVSVTMLLYRKKSINPDSGVTFYGFSEEIDLTAYLPEGQSEALLAEYNGIAFNCDADKCFVNGNYTSVDAKIITKNSEDNLIIDGTLFSQITGIEVESATYTPEFLGEKINKSVAIYKDKLVVFFDADAEVNVFDNYYTFEYISMMLRGASEADIKNAFIQLPSDISNNENLTIKYTDPDLELGLSTSLYALQGASGSEVKANGVKMAVGEGESSKNHTVVRVYNEYSSKISQFLAFPGDVTGGVKVACANVTDDKGNERGVIATCAYNSKFSTSKFVNVYDVYGMIYMKIVPEFFGNAPYNILTGKFIEECDDPQLLITSDTVDGEGKLKYEIYSLKDGSLISSGEEIMPDKVFNSSFELSIKSAEKDRAIIYFEGKECSFLMSFSKNATEYSEIDINSSAYGNGLYESAFSDDGYVETLSVKGNDAHRSFVAIFTDGSEFYNKLDVGTYENTFFWCSNDSDISSAGLTLSDSKYVKRATYNHIRTDFSAKIVSILSNKSIKTLSEADYSKWCIKKDFFADYSLTYNVWEPCFSQRWGKTSAAKNLIEYQDKNGDNIFASYTADNSLADYYEGDSSFYVGTYAEGLIELDKMRIYPLRDTLSQLYTYFSQDPEKTAALEPIHEIEINVGDTVGDYNPNMIEGFRSFLLGRYGSVEEINTRLGTAFTSRSDIDAPRNGALGERGDWDKYSSDFFEEWCIYTRQIVYKRMCEAYREALLCGFPSEIITGHSIPEGDAISGFLGQADTRMSPVDAMMTLGTGFGATRYGVWFSDDSNFLILARNAGFKSVTLGEYNSLSDSYDDSLSQMKYLWENGVKMINLLNVSVGGTKNDLKSIKTLIEDNNPKPGYAGGTSHSVAVKTETETYQIVEMGSSSSSNSLLKSIDENGNWTGDVYLVPFHSQIYVETCSFSTNARAGGSSQIFGELNTGDVIELNFTGSYVGKNENVTLCIDVYENGKYNETLSTKFTLTSETQNYKYIISNQTPLGNITIKPRYECGNDYKNVKIESFTGSTQRESVARKYYGDTSATEHVGGVTFDIFR